MPPHLRTLASGFDGGYMALNGETSTVPQLPLPALSFDAGSVPPFGDTNTTPQLPLPAPGFDAGLMALNGDTSTASPLEIPTRGLGAADPQEELQNDVNALLEFWAKLGTLIQRFEAHDQSLERVVTQWTSLIQSPDVRVLPENTCRASPAESCPSAYPRGYSATQDLREKYVMPSNQKIFREEGTHAAITDVTPGVQCTTQSTLERVNEETASEEESPCTESPKQGGQRLLIEDIIHGTSQDSTSTFSNESPEHADNSLNGGSSGWRRGSSPSCRSQEEEEDIDPQKSEVDNVRKSLKNRYKSLRESRLSEGFTSRAAACREKRSTMDSAQPRNDTVSSNKSTTRLRTARTITQIGDKHTHLLWVGARFVQSWPFQAFCAMVIFLNMVVIVAETEYESMYLASNNHFKNVNIALNAWYTFEASVKIWALRNFYFTGPDRSWNIMDVVIVFVCIADFLLTQLTGFTEAGNLKMAKSVRIFRLARVVRVVRLFRFMRFATEFKKMVLSMTNCLATLFWSMVVLFFVTWGFGVALTQLITESWMDGVSGKPESVQALRPMFKHIPIGMYYLFQSVTGGLDWGPVCELLFELDTIGGALFISYIIFTCFGVLNIVTSVFVESAWRATQTHRELLVDDKIRAKKMYANHVRTIFQSLDVNGTGMISLENIELIFEDKDLRDFLDALEVNTVDARTLFRLLDYDQSGLIGSDEFVEGCLKLKGDAKSFDVNCLIYENERNLKVSREFMTDAKGVLLEMSEKIHEVSCMITNLNAARHSLDASAARTADRFEELARGSGLAALGSFAMMPGGDLKTKLNGKGNASAHGVDDQPDVMPEENLAGHLLQFRARLGNRASERAP